MLLYMNINRRPYYGIESGGSRQFTPQVAFFGNLTRVSRDMKILLIILLMFSRKVNAGDFGTILLFFHSFFRELNKMYLNCSMKKRYCGILRIAKHLCVCIECRITNTRRGIYLTGCLLCALRVFGDIGWMPFSFDEKNVARLILAP